MTKLFLPFLFLTCYSSYSQQNNTNIKDEIKTVSFIDTAAIFDPKTFVEELKIVREDITFHTLPEVMPEFPGGENALLKNVISNLAYPQKMKQDKKEGTTIMTFIVDELGQLKHPTIIKSITQEFDQAARDCISKMQHIIWQPGMIDGKPVSVLITLPIKFKLE